MFEPWQWPLLFLTGMAAGFVDAIAGGGGLITLPVILSFGGDPQQALGTNKLQATFGSASAAWHYGRAGAVNLHDCGRGCLLTFVGAAVGTLGVQQVGPHVLKVAIPLLLLAVAIYTLLRPQLGERDLHPRMARFKFDFLFGLLLGFYDGFFGPGTGTFWTMVFVLMLGFNLTRATAHTKVMNFASNLCSLLLFAAIGKVDYAAGVAMGAGQLLGARFGSKMVLARGTRFIRPVFITVVLALTLKLLYDVYLKR
ncbi:MAG: TSUP family transporter [Verrucomicrobia bacterium]|nr:TSUP family transporter [Verrucomicrobiota bacterium]